MTSDDTVLASASGILQCLRLLAEEAATLNMHRTISAIREALDVAAEESAGEDYQESFVSGSMLSLH